MPLPDLSLRRLMSARRGKPLLPLLNSIAGRPVCPPIGSSVCPGVPCLRPSMPKTPRLPRRSRHGVLFSPGCCMSSLVSNVPRNPSRPNVETYYSSTPLLLPLPYSCRRALPIAEMVPLAPFASTRDHGASTLLCTPFTF